MKIRHILAISFRRVERETGPLLATFYTLHQVHNDGLLYVSETIGADPDPDFGQLAIPLEVQHQLCFVIRLWGYGTDWTKVVERRVDLNELVHVGQNGVHDTHFDANTHIMRLTKGIYYTSPECVKQDISDERTISVGRRFKPSYTFDSIRAINSLHRSITELKMIERKLSTQIDSNISSLAPDTTTSTAIHCATLKELITKQTVTNDKILSQLLRYKTRISEINQAIHGDSSSAYTQNQIAIMESQFDPLNESLDLTVLPQTLTQIKLLTATVAEVFSIDNVSNSLQFAILGLKFPSNIRALLDICYYGSDWLQVERINAALGYICRMVLMLADITDLCLRYNILTEQDKWYIWQTTGNSTVQCQLFYSPDKNEKVTTRDKSCPRNYTLYNAPFEMGLKLLNFDILSLVKHSHLLLRTCSWPRRHLEKQPDQKQNHSYSLLDIPIDCVDNYLWNLHFVMLYLTSSSPTTT